MVVSEIPHWVLFILLTVLISSEIVNWYNNYKIKVKIRMFELSLNNTISSKFKILLTSVDKLLIDNMEVKSLIESKLNELEEMISDLPNNDVMINKVVEFENSLNEDIQKLMSNTEEIVTEIKQLNVSSKSS